jgi:hypothetical protein
MDLAKIIAELKMELQCLETAIASVERLARVQNVADVSALTGIPAESKPPESGPGGPVPVKRRRGRPRKNEPKVEVAAQ